MLKFKYKERVYGICYTGVFPEVERGVIVDTDKTADPPTYAIARDSNGELFVASEEDVGATLDDLKERRIEMLRLYKTSLIENAKRIKCEINKLT